MKLTELDPKWVGRDGPVIDDARQAVGVMLNCPHCIAHRFWIPFTTPHDGGPPKTSMHWENSGDSFESLTLQPSILIHDHWHGYITNGEIITCGDSPSFVTQSAA